MARCHSCGINLGWGPFSKAEILDGHRFCRPCSDEWYEQRRKCVLSQICQGGDPVEIFTIPKVRTRNPDKPKSRELLLGITAFTDRGVCFIQTGLHFKADSGLGLAFGLIGHAIAESNARKKMKKTFAEGEHEIIDQADSFVDLLSRAEQLFFYPRQEITKLRFDSSGFDIRMGKFRKRFATSGGRKAFKQFREIAGVYRTAIENNADPVLASKYLQTGLNRCGLSCRDIDQTP